MATQTQGAVPDKGFVFESAITAAGGHGTSVSNGVLSKQIVPNDILEDGEEPFSLEDGWSIPSNTCDSAFTRSYPPEMRLEDITLPYQTSDMCRRDHIYIYSGKGVTMHRVDKGVGKSNSIRVNKGVGKSNSVISYYDSAGPGDQPLRVTWLCCNNRGRCIRERTH